EVEIPGAVGNVEHPGVGPHPVVQEVLPCAHEADGAGGADPVVGARKQDGAQAAAGEPAAADARGVDVGPRQQVIDGAPVFVGIDSRPGGAGGEAGLGEDVLVLPREGVVGADVVRRSRLQTLETALVAIAEWLDRYGAAPGPGRVLD